MNPMKETTQSPKMKAIPFNTVDRAFRDMVSTKSYTLGDLAPLWNKVVNEGGQFMDLFNPEMTITKVHLDSFESAGFKFETLNLEETWMRSDIPGAKSCHSVTGRYPANNGNMGYVLNPNGLTLRVFKDKGTSSSSSTPYLVEENSVSRYRELWPTLEKKINAGLVGNTIFVVNILFASVDGRPTAVINRPYGDLITPVNKLAFTIIVNHLRSLGFNVCLLSSNGNGSNWDGKINWKGLMSHPDYSQRLTFATPPYKFPVAEPGVFPAYIYPDGEVNWVIHADKDAGYKFFDDVLYENVGFVGTCYPVVNGMDGQLGPQSVKNTTVKKTNIGSCYRGGFSKSITAEYTEFMRGKLSEIVEPHKRDIKAMVLRRKFSLEANDCLDRKMSKLPTPTTYKELSDITTKFDWEDVRNEITAIKDVIMAQVDDVITHDPFATALGDVNEFRKLFWAVE